MTAVVVVPYDEQWPVLFDEIAAHLHTALAGVPVVAIEHVGSTSVPGLAAKPVIDIDVVVHRDDVPVAIGALENAGYRHRGDLGVVDRHSMAEPGGVRRNVYVTVAGSLALRNHLAVRDTLRSDRHLAQRYASEKRELAAVHDSVDDYAIAKSAIIQEILEAAGMPAEDRAAIAVVNRPAPADS